MPYSQPPPPTPPVMFRVFPTGGNGGGVPLYQPKICSFPPVDSPHQILSPPPKVDPPRTKQQFSKVIFKTHRSF